MLARAGLPTMYSLLRQHRLRWLGHVRRMDNGRIPNDIFYGELFSGKRALGHPQLRFKHVCKRDMKALDICPETWDRRNWRRVLGDSLASGEDKLLATAETKRSLRKIRRDLPPSTHICFSCKKNCHLNIGLISHRRSCSRGKSSDLH